MPIASKASATSAPTRKTDGEGLKLTIEPST
jgi:hypothetical protein